jgi:hypothetical protein
MLGINQVTASFKLNTPLISVLDRAYKTITYAAQSLTYITFLKRK